MLSETENKSGSIRNSFNKIDNIYNARSIAVSLTKNTIPASHKRIADNYLVIKKIFKFQACMSRISNVEKSLLEKYDFNTLEYTTLKQMSDELELLQKWSNSSDEEQRNLADNILLIRAKELKFLEASSYATISNEIYNGYMALEQYFREISHYQTSQNIRLLSY